MVDDPSQKTMDRAAQGHQSAPTRTRCRRWAARLFRDARVFLTATVDPRVPWHARLSAAAMPAAYYIAPLDPIPNRLPVLGHLDDVVVALLAIALFVRLVPVALRDRLRADLPEPSADRVISAAVTALGLIVVAAITVPWSALLVWGVIWLFRS
jgi:uncharacterized membrane protein YkvA (DUF1232 family)